MAGRTMMVQEVSMNGLPPPPPLSAMLGTLRGTCELGLMPRGTSGCGVVARVAGKNEPREKYCGCDIGTNILLAYIHMAVAVLHW
jgi:hypothetical protein